MSLIGRMRSKGFSRFLGKKWLVFGKLFFMSLLPGREGLIVHTYLVPIGLIWAVARSDFGALASADC